MLKPPAPNLRTSHNIYITQQILHDKKHTQNRRLVSLRRHTFAKRKNKAIIARSVNKMFGNFSMRSASSSRKSKQNDFNDDEALRSSLALLRETYELIKAHDNFSPSLHETMKKVTQRVTIFYA